MASKRTLAIWMTVGAASFWGTSFPVIKWGLAFVGPHTFALLRFLIAALVTVVIGLVLGKFSIHIFRRKILWGLALFNSLGFAFQFVALELTTASKTSLLVSLNLLFVAIASRWVFREEFPVRKILSLLAAFVGVFLLTTRGDLSVLSGLEFRGDMLALGSGISWAGFIVLQKHLEEKETVDLTELFGGLMPLTALFLLPFFLIYEPQGLFIIERTGWLAVLYIGIFCTAIAYYLWGEGLKSLTATSSTILILFEVVVALSLSIAWLGESFTLLTALGAALVLAAITGVSFPEEEDEE